MLSEIFWERNQQRKIAEVQLDASKAKGHAERIENRVYYLERRLERLSLTCQALWELLRENTEFKEDDILTKMTEVDLRDGTADGKIGYTVLSCPTCNRPVNSKRDTCLYCGADIPKDHVFE